jgi:hypothetical protein
VPPACANAFEAMNIKTSNEARDETRIPLIVFSVFLFTCTLKGGDKWLEFAVRS